MSTICAACLHVMLGRFSRYCQHACKPVLATCMQAAKHVEGGATSLYTSALGKSLCAVISGLLPSRSQGILLVVATCYDYNVGKCNWKACLTTGRASHVMLTLPAKLRVTSYIPLVHAGEQQRWLQGVPEAVHHEVDCKTKQDEVQAGTHLQATEVCVDAQATPTVLLLNRRPHSQVTAGNRPPPPNKSCHALHFLATLHIQLACTLLTQADASLHWNISEGSTQLHQVLPAGHCGQRSCQYTCYTPGA